MSVSAKILQTPSLPSYSLLQRWTALGLGIVCHGLFASSVVVMFVSLYSGLTWGWGYLHGGLAVCANALLLAQFAVLHSLLLTDRGRRWMSLLAPFGLGKVLSTTLFASIASLQLLLVFLLWSPSQVMWAVPHGWPEHGMTLLYVLSWVYLVKAMNDAGMDVQTGAVGWWSVWRNQTPVYKPFSRTGTFRYVRQPIYVSFALILWTSPVWTPDHLFAALLWTVYCLVAPLMKEKRYRRFYGEAFARYQKRVPYWFPRLRKPSSGTFAASSPPVDCDVLIIGAGPVGLLLANLLAMRGKRVRVLEKRTEPWQHSQAIGITPPSLQILAQLGLADVFIEKGVSIEKVFVHGESGHLGVCDFTLLDGPHRFVLALPQPVTMNLLEKKLGTFAQARVDYGWDVQTLDQQEDHVVVKGHGPHGLIDVCARHVVACDGSKGKVRDLLKIRTQGGSYACHFAMADFPDQTILGQEAHLFFTFDGAVESFPLPDQRRRWIVQTETFAENPDPQKIAETVRQRTGLNLTLGEGAAARAFTPRWMQAETYHDGRVFLCGDAAHVMSPIGGQGMNTGFADAEFLSVALSAMQADPSTSAAWSSAYDRIRSKAVLAAMRHAEWGMRLGILRENVASGIRDFVMREVLFSPIMARTLASLFSMQGISGRTLQHIPAGKIPPNAKFLTGQPCRNKAENSSP